MSLSTNEIALLKKLVSIAEKLLEANSGSKFSSKSVVTAKAAPKKRKRRAGKELVEFRKMLKAERNKGASVAELSQKYSVSQAYIYQL
jgi:hypothetical protein